ncbi:MAG: hypothetical protein QG629_913 [Patescibacteria group bacterium]|nr:site-2 protease family protein [Candidatus Saccharibacteria bacterium]MDQ5963830.1 hypothetical protein [Patescibacteria group bacterium]
MLETLGPLGIVYLIAFILIGLTVHEFMHAYTGHLLGDSTAKDQGRISLNPLDHIDPIMTIGLPILTVLLFQAPILAAKPVPFDPARVRFGDMGAALVAAAGPLSNLVLAILGVGLGGIIGMSQVLFMFVALNVSLFIFNLIPIPPLDGSRVLYAFMPESVRDLMDQIEPVGLFIIFGLVLMGGFGGWLSGLNRAVLSLLGIG